MIKIFIYWYLKTFHVFIFGLQVGPLDLVSSAWNWGLFDKKLTKKQKEKRRLKKEKKKQSYIDETSLSDTDVKGVIDQLTRQIGTQVQGQQNQALDTLGDVPLATQVASNAGIEQRGNQAIAGVVPQLEMAQAESKINATKAWYGRKDERKAYREQQKLQEDAGIMGLFQNVGSTVIENPELLAMLL